MEDLTIDEIRDILGKDEFQRVIAKAKQQREEKVLAALERAVTEEARSLIRAGRATAEDLRRIFLSVEVDDSGEVYIRALPLEARPRASSGGRGRRGRARRIDRTQERVFRCPILQALEERGGRTRTDEVRQLLRQKMNGQLTSDDHEPVPSTGEERWWNTAKWERKHMIQERPPLLNPSSPRGWWEITEAGREYLRRNCSGGSG